MHSSDSSPDLTSCFCNLRGFGLSFVSSEAFASCSDPLWTLSLSASVAFFSLSELSSVLFFSMLKPLPNDKPEPNANGFFVLLSEAGKLSVLVVASPSFVSFLATPNPVPNLDAAPNTNLSSFLSSSTLPDSTVFPSSTLIFLCDGSWSFLPSSFFSSSFLLGASDLSLVSSACSSLSFSLGLLGVPSSLSIGFSTAVCFTSEFSLAALPPLVSLMLSKFMRTCFVQIDLLTFWFE
ncbi:hypothetical protein AWRI1631_91010 [Saccharomyces cerevisiae AWRI1631]|uniref:Uncharacterized protein n=1 Tax=Saccharomyces cerevisiae (strain AWRI1631) TaxID=545124 RepID=B5VKN9_YEAS6|nr:hypothetical protein AWRI1631_91010 [Saccharomyces cerevisiae AWRI1631]